MSGNGNGGDPTGGDPGSGSISGGKSSAVDAGGSVTTDQFHSSISENFQSSNLAQPSSLTEGWRKLGQQLAPSDGAGSGKIDPSTLNNDAQWLRVFSLVVYKSGVASGQQQAQVTAGTTPGVGGASLGRNVVPFPLPRATASASASSSGEAGANDTGKSTQQLPGLDLSNLRCVFNINGTTMSTPDQLTARVYNLAPSTLAKVIEFTRVQIHAGYKYANYGLIFDGTVMQYRRGKENPVDTYLEILAFDGDDILNNSTVFDTVPAGSKEGDVVNKLNDAMAKRAAANNEPFNPQNQNDLNRVMQRDTVLAGSVKNYTRQIMQGLDMSAFLNSGQYIMMSRTGYRDGEVVILSPKTGLVGLPEVTPQGIQAKCLLNPKLRLGGLVQIDSNILSGVAYTPGTASKTDASGNVIPGDPSGGVVLNPTVMWGQQLETAYTSPIGRYRILLLNYNGDTRGNPWYCDLICIAVNKDGSPVLKDNPSAYKTFQRASPKARKTNPAG